MSKGLGRLNDGWKCCAACVRVCVCVCVAAVHLLCGYEEEERTEQLVSASESAALTTDECDGDSPAADVDSGRLLDCSVDQCPPGTYCRRSAVDIAAQPSVARCCPKGIMLIHQLVSK